MTRSTMGATLAMATIAFGQMACVPSTMPSFLKKETKEAPVAPSPTTPKEVGVRIQPGKIDDANASDMLQELRKEIDEAGVSNQSK